MAILLTTLFFSTHQPPSNRKPETLSPPDPYLGSSRDEGPFFGGSYQAAELKEKLTQKGTHKPINP